MTYLSVMRPQHVTYYVNIIYLFKKPQDVIHLLKYKFLDSNSIIYLYKPRLNT